MALAARPKSIKTVQELHEATCDGYVAAEAAAALADVEVVGAGRRLSMWPPLLSTFTRVTRIVIKGHFITALPSSVGELVNLQSLAVTGGCLSAVPQEMSNLSALRDLDLSRNELQVFPHQLCGLTGLTSLNLMGNRLTQLPAQFGALASLQKLGLKSNALKALPPSFTQLTSLVELFITDNALTALPEGFGALASLVKLQASFNPWATLPPDLLALPRLELFRLAAGALPAWPPGGASSRPKAAAAAAPAGLPPALAWCSLGGNPAAAPVPAIPDGTPCVDLRGPELEVDRKALLGDGASGECFKAKYKGEQVALKVFLSEVSPDGKAQDEVAITCSLDHPNLTRVKALVFDKTDRWPAPPETGTDGNGAAAAHGAGAGGAGGGVGRGCGGEHFGEAAKGMVLDLVAGRPLAAKPTSEHLLRCKWPGDASFRLRAALSILRGVAGALAHLHARRICHGDVYAHNVLYCPDTQRAVLCDFGASFCYHETETFWEAMEVRAFGLFMTDVVERIEASAAGGAAAAATARLRALAAQCAAAGGVRPPFVEIETELARIAEQS